MSARHSEQTSIHRPYTWSYANATARAAATGFVALDVHKLCLQEDDNSLWMLTATTPTWTQIGASASSAPADATYIVEDAHSGLSAEVTLATVIKTDTFANRPAAAKAGRIFMPSDGYYAYRDGGSAWAAWGPLFPLTVPVDAEFSWVNQGGATVETTYDGIFLNAPAAAGDNVRARVKSAPATPWTLTCLVLPMTQPVAYHTVGICVRESSTGKMHILSVGAYAVANTITIGIKNMNTATAFGAIAASTQGNPIWHPIWVRINDDGTDLKFLISADGRHFSQYYSCARTSFMSGGPDQIGFCADANNASVGSGILLLSWKVT